MDAGSDGGMDSAEEGQWLTYSELAGIRRIDRHSAVKLVMRRGWRRQKDNRGVLRILVPPEWALSKGGGTDKGPDKSDWATRRGTDIGMDNGTDISRAISALEAAVTSITQRAENAEKRADHAEIRAESAETHATQIELALSEERKRADQAETDRDRLVSDLKAARMAQGEAEARAAEVRERLAAAEGLAKSAERAVAELRQAETIADRAERDRAVAVAIADEAVRAAEELRQIQATRAGQGRWARLRLAWRGE